MKTILLVLFLCSSFLFFLLIFQLVFNKKYKHVEKRLRYYLLSDEKQEIKRETFNFFVQMKMYNRKLKTSLEKKKGNPKHDQLLRSAGIPLTASEYIFFRWVIVIALGGITYIATANVILLIFSSIVGFLYPKLWVKQKRKKRIKKFNDGLADMITTIVSSLRAGFSFMQSLKAVTEEAEEPIKEEIQTVLKEIQYGSNLEDALQQLHERMPSKDIEIMIQAILIQRQVGGNLATVLNTIVDTIREREKIHNQVQALTAQGRLSGMVIGFLPFALGGIIYILQPSYIGLLFKNTIGIIMLSTSIIFGIIGYLLIQKLTKIEV